MMATEDLQGFMDGLRADAAARPAEYTKCVLSDKGVVHVPTCVLRRHSPVLTEFLSSEGERGAASSTLELVETTRPFAQFVAAIFPDLERRVFLCARRSSAEFVRNVFGIAHKYKADVVMDTCFCWAVAPERSISVSARGVPSSDDGTLETLLQLDHLWPDHPPFPDPLDVGLARWLFAPDDIDEARLQYLRPATLKRIMDACTDGTRSVYNAYRRTIKFDAYYDPV